MVRASWKHVNEFQEFLHLVLDDYEEASLPLPSSLPIIRFNCRAFAVDVLTVP